MFNTTNLSWAINTMKNNFIYKPLTPDDFNHIITLANVVHGDGYLDLEQMNTWYLKGIYNNINAGFVVYDDKKLIGFRATFAANNWDIDQWSTPSLWKTPANKVCYFKCNTVDENYRGYGVGGKLLKLSIQACKKQGAQAGASHLWKQSPNNSAVAYFTKCGGELIKLHPDKWNKESKNGYNCVLCGFDCHCEAAEMMIYFD
jgi:GNAT superfamily N-acetyltransferase